MRRGAVARATRIVPAAVRRRLFEIADHLHLDLGKTYSLAIQSYLDRGQIPWSPGYAKYKDEVIRGTLADDGLMAGFLAGQPLPDGYGRRLDERVVEYPWVLARLRARPGRVLDAGSTFSTGLVLDLPWMHGRNLVIYTLDTSTVVRRPHVRFVYGDLRALALQDGSVETVACISTLEHVGMAQSFDYSTRRPYPAASPDDALLALAELRRVLAPGGRLLLTVPYGRREDHGWLQQFDHTGIRRLVDAFAGDLVSEAYYAYTTGGWHLSSADACADARYFDVHAASAIEPDGAAAARAVCCLELARP
jgi:SAM-dependent methyltransferase